MNLLLMIQEGAERVGQTAQPTEEAPALVRWINDAIGPATVPIQQAVMTPIYGLFGAHWTPPARGEEIPAHVIFATIAFLLATLGLWAFRGTLSVDRPSTRQQ